MATGLANLPNPDCTNSSPRTINRCPLDSRPVRTCSSRPKSTLLKGVLQSILDASMASWGPIPKSTVLTMSCVTQLVIRRPPDAPTDILTPSPSSTRAGLMLLRGSLPGMIELMRPGMGSHQSMPLFITTPVPLGTIPDPNPPPTVLVRETALPSESMAHRWVVPVSKAGRLAGSASRDLRPSSTHGSPGAYSAGALSVIEARRRLVYESETRPSQGTSTCSGSAMYRKRSA